MVVIAINIVESFVTSFAQTHSHELIPNTIFHINKHPSSTQAPPEEETKDINLSFVVIRNLLLGLEEKLFYDEMDLWVYSEDDLVEKYAHGLQALEKCITERIQEIYGIDIVGGKEQEELVKGNVVRYTCKATPATTTNSAMKKRSKASETEEDDSELGASHAVKSLKKLKVTMQSTRKSSANDDQSSIATASQQGSSITSSNHHYRTNAVTSSSSSITKTPVKTTRNGNGQSLLTSSRRKNKNEIPAKNKTSKHKEVTTINIDAEEDDRSLQSLEGSMDFVEEENE